MFTGVRFLINPDHNLSKSPLKNDLNIETSFTPIVMDEMIMIYDGKREAKKSLKIPHRQYGELGG